MCIFPEKKREEKVLCAICRYMENLYPAFCLLHQFEWLRFCCFLFYIFSILHIFQSGPAILWTENCWMELNSAFAFRNLAEMTCTIFVCATLRPQSWKCLWCLQMCALALWTLHSVHCAVFQICALCTVQCFRCVHCAVCSHSVGQVSQGYKGNNSNSAINAKETSSKQTCVQHSLHCIS